MLMAAISAIMGQSEVRPMARKAKKKLHKMPKLSFVDQLIYWGGWVCLAVAWFGSIIAHDLQRKRIAFADAMVIAAEDKASYLWVLIPWMVFFLITFIPWMTWHQERRPIFGLRNFKYGPPAYPKIYPVFMKNKPYVWVSEKKEKDKRIVALVLLLIFLISMLFYPLSLYGRECLLSDGTVEQYNMFNRKVEEAPSGQISAVNFKVYKHNVRKSYQKRWDVLITLTTAEGKKYSFEYRDFRDAFDGDPCNWLTAMLQVKGRYVPDIITYTGMDDLEKCISSNSLSETEANMLYQLFDLSV